MTHLIYLTMGDMTSNVFFKVIIDK